MLLMVYFTFSSPYFARSGALAQFVKSLRCFHLVSSLHVPGQCLHASRFGANYVVGSRGSSQFPVDVKQTSLGVVISTRRIEPWPATHLPSYSRADFAPGNWLRLFGNCRAAFTEYGSAPECCKQARNESRRR